MHTVAMLLAKATGTVFCVAAFWAWISDDYAAVISRSDSNAAGPQVGDQVLNWLLLIFLGCIGYIFLKVGHQPKRR